MSAPKPVRDDAGRPEPLLDLERLAAGIRWRRRMWVSLALLGLLLGALGTLVLPPAPTALVRMMIVHENDEASASEELMKTDVALLETTRTAAAALRRLGSPQPAEDFLKSYEGSGLTGNVLEVRATGPNRAAAVARAEAIAEVFIAGHVERAEAAAGAEAQALRDRREQAANELASAGEPGYRAELESRINDLEQQIRQATVGVPRVAEGTQIVDGPREVTNSLAKAAAVNMAVGLVLGLGCGLALAAVAAVMRDRPVLRKDIAEHLGASVIAQLPAPRMRLWPGGRSSNPDGTELGKLAATVARALRDDLTGVSVLELGCPGTATAWSEEIAATLGVDAGPAVGSVEPGTAWTDLPVLGFETLLVVRAGHASTSWLHTVAGQLADLGIVVIGVVLVHPDPRDRSDGTLWDGLHTALRGRAARAAATERAAAGAPEPRGDGDRMTRYLPSVGSATSETRSSL